MESQKGASTGDNSGIYPDEILEHNICTGSNSEKYREFKFEGFSAGTYKIRLFCSTIHANSSSERSRWKVNVDGVETEFSIPAGFNPNNNLTQDDDHRTFGINIAADLVSNALQDRAEANNGILKG